MSAEEFKAVVMIVCFVVGVAVGLLALWAIPAIESLLNDRAHGKKIEEALQRELDRLIREARERDEAREADTDQS